MKVQSFEGLIAWQKARDLTKQIYCLTKREPFCRDFGLCSQMQRAAVSIMANLAEGFERGSSAEFHQFIVISKGSCAELINGLIIVFTRGAILFSVVFPAKAGNQLKHSWMPAFAGMTDVGLIMRPLILTFLETIKARAAPNWRAALLDTRIIRG